jgi:uncharacterized membrane protein
MFLLTNKMQSKLLYLSFLSGLTLLTCFSLAMAQPDTITVDVITTFDYPDPDFSIETVGQISDRGEVVGGGTVEIREGTFTFLGFYRRPNGKFSPPLKGPSGHYAQAFGINNSNVICGNYANRYGSHGFLLSNGIYTTYDAPGSVATAIFGNNDVGDFVGGYAISGGGGVYHPFAYIGGTFIPIELVDNPASVAGDINNFGEVVGSADGHMFLRDSDGTVTYPIDAPDQSYLYVYGINDSGMIVGGSNELGFVWKYPNTFVTFSVPGSTYTEAGGINNSGMISGRYEDPDGSFHGFIAQVRAQ